MERRTFIRVMSGLAAGGAAAAECVFYRLETRQGFRQDKAAAIELKAFAAAHLPQSAMLYLDQGPRAELLGSYERFVFDSEAIYEIRRYEPTVPEPGILARHGIQPILLNESTLVVEFRSLSARDEAWNAVSSDEEWKRSIRRVAEIGLYRVA